jgi:hypothetical protein
MALPTSSGVNFYNQDELQAWITSYGMEIANSMPPFSLATRWWAKFALMAPNAPKKLTLPFPLSVPALSPSTGRDQPQMSTTEFATYDRDDPQYIGHMQPLQRLQGGDFGALAMAPSQIAAAIDNAPDIGFGSKIGQGFTTNDWTGTKFLVLNTAGASDQKPVNPGMPALGKYTNCRENFAFTSDNVTTLIEDLNSRKGFDGRYLRNDKRSLLCWVPPTKAEEAHQILERIEWSVASGDGGVTRAYKRLPYEIVTDLRTDLWGVAIVPQTPWELPFLYMMGNNPNSEQTISGFPSFQVQQGQDTTPHRQLEIIDTQHYLYQTARMLGYQAWVNESYHLLSGIGVAMAFTGAAS